MKTYYYKNETDEVIEDNFEKVEKIDENYKYIHKNIFWNISSFLLYRIFLWIPISLYVKLKLHYKVIKNESYKKLKKEKNGYFIYGNHTQKIGDTFFPSYINYPRKTFEIANAKNVSIKGLKTINKMVGALPIPDDIKGYKNFLNTIKLYIKKKKSIAIYPEAHVWPYYTKIRNFSDVSFKYPVELNVNSYCFTVTYQKNKNSFKTIIYVDGPFKPKKDLNKKGAAKYLRNQIFDAMENRSKNNNINLANYIKNE